MPICADESCHDRTSLPGLRGKYDMVNIKLDKAGGLTEALALREAAIAQGFGIMVGCMVGSSLAMAPAVLVAQGAAIADLDGPLLLAEDRATRSAMTRTGLPARPRTVGRDPRRLTMTRTVFVNRRLSSRTDAKVSIFDRGFLMADGCMK